MSEALEDLAGLRFSLVGPGRVGRSLAGWAVARGARLSAVGGRRPGEPAWPGGPRQVAPGALESAGEDLLLVAVPDGALPAVTAELAAAGDQAAVVLHASGAIGAEVLAPLRSAGTAVGSLHPLKAFPVALPDPAEARGVFFALDGDPEARRLGERLAAAWGADAAEVAAAARPLYHFAATLAAGGVVTLLAAAAEIAATAGLPRAVVAGYLELARGALAAAGQAHVAGARLGECVTGPVARGDLRTFESHLHALARSLPQKVPLAVCLAHETRRQREAARGPVKGREGRTAVDAD
jgi:predicted short-subunit dehydrogenase-like oxidoreductase (DUF2520 family)